ncbi:MAG TPA: lysylphosphatidylglycerol synthase transmembrane domain-containing protein [Chloroflexota bacterium]
MNQSASEAKPARSFRLSLILPILLAAVLLYFAFRGVRWSDFLNTIRHGRPQYLVLGFLGVTCTYFLRGVRWRILLTAEGEVALLTSFFAVVVGYLGNYVLPARAGEVIRSVLVSRKTTLSVSYVLATAITERIMDSVTLVLISVVALTTLSGLPAWLLTAAKVMAVIACVGLVFIFVAPRFESQLGALLHRLPAPASVGERLDGLLGQFLRGMRALHSPQRAFAFIGLSLPIWIGDGLVTVSVALALNLSLSLPQGLLLLAALGLSSAAPSTPGYVGVFQFVAVTVLAPFGFTHSQALAYIITYQALIYIVVLFWGPIGLWRLQGWSRSTLDLSLDTPIPSATESDMPAETAATRSTSS